MNIDAAALVDDDHTSLCAPNNDTNVPKALLSIYTLDILTMVVRHLPWVDLIRVAHWPQPAPLLVEPEKRRRIFSLLRRFVPVEYNMSKYIEEFFDRLHDCGGVINVSTVRVLLLSGTELGTGLPEPRDLNIATSSGMSDGMYEFFRSLGYESTAVNAAPHHNKSARHIERMTMDIEGEVRSKSMSKLLRSKVF